MGFPWRKFASYAAVFLIGLVVGYFAGREHLKYEIRTALQSAAQQLQQGLAGATKSTTTGLPQSVTAPQASPNTSAQKPIEPTPLSITLVSKGFHASDPQAGDFEDDITFKISIKNLTGKEIRAFDGTLTFTDLLDNEIISSQLSIDDPIPKGAPVSWDGALKYNQFMDSHQRLRAEDQRNLKVIFTAHKVLFADGTTKEYQ